MDGQELTRLTIDFTTELGHDYSLFFEDAVVFYAPTGQAIDKIRLKFTSQDIVTLQKARETLVAIAEGILDKLNGEGFVGTQPLTVDMLEICVTYESYCGLYIDGRYVHWVKLEDSMAYYYCFDITNEFDVWDMDSECWHQRVETYEKTLQIVTYTKEAEINYQLSHPKKASLFEESIISRPIGNRSASSRDSLTIPARSTSLYLSPETSK